MNARMALAGRATVKKSILNEYVLMLNKSWLPVDTCSVKSAFGRIFMENARFMDTTGDSYSLHDVESWLSLEVTDGMPFVTTARTRIRVPEILVLQSDVTPKRRVMQFSRRNLGRRDRMTCQYCGDRPGAQDLTMDHIMPRSRGGKSNWHNCVLSCFPCNSRKANRTPKEAGMAFRVRPEMKILHPTQRDKWVEPYEPAWSPVFRVSASCLKESWKRFLPDKMLDALSVT